MKNKTSCCVSGNSLAILALVVSVVALFFSFSLYSAGGSVKSMVSVNDSYSDYEFTASPKVLVRTAAPSLFKFHATIPFSKVSEIQLLQDGKVLSPISTFSDDRGELVISVSSTLIKSNLATSQKTSKFVLKANVDGEPIADLSTSISIK